MGVEALPSVDAKNEAEELRKRGVEYFIKMSHAFPASVTAQGLALAIRCKNEQSDPLALMQAVTADTEAIKDIITAANEAHARRGVEIDGDAMAVRTVNIVNNVGEIAKSAMGFETAALRGVLKGFPRDLPADFRERVFGLSARVALGQLRRPFIQPRPASA